MKVYDFKVLLEPDEDAMDNIKEAILLCLEDLVAQNQPIPDMSKILISSVAVAV
jgi:predicted RNase H-like HicB family nuclease